MLGFRKRQRSPFTKLDFTPPMSRRALAKIVARYNESQPVVPMPDIPSFLAEAHREVEVRGVTKTEKCQNGDTHHYVWTDSENGPYWRLVSVDHADGGTTFFTPRKLDAGETVTVTGTEVTL
jgi:hypothetical protein